MPLKNYLIKIKQTSISKEKQTHRYRAQTTSGYQWGEERRERKERGRGLRGKTVCIKYK